MCDSVLISNFLLHCNDTSLCRQIDMPLKSHTTIDITHNSGIIGEPRPSNIADSSTLLSIIFIAIALVLFNFKHCRRLFRSLSHELLNDRQRANAFDERTSNENRVLAILIFVLCIFEGIILFFISNPSTPANNSHNAILIPCLIGLCIGYYIFQLIALVTVSYSFGDKTSMTQWIKGFNGSQIISLSLLAIPTLTMIFHPNLISEMLILSIILYFIVRILFIFKGFRIFYNKIYSLVYFILYLCTLEIIPVIFLYSGALYLREILQ